MKYLDPQASGPVVTHSTVFIISVFICKAYNTAYFDAERFLSSCNIKVTHIYKSLCAPSENMAFGCS